MIKEISVEDPSMHVHSCIGIIGGMSPQSTVTYYQTIIDLHYAKFGEHSYPRIVIGSELVYPRWDDC